MPAVTEINPEDGTPQDSYAVDIRPGKIIDLPANLRRQFYPPIMLLEALSRPTVLKRRAHDDASSCGDEYDPQQIFQHFVNRLALICHVEPNGDSVSSCVVIQEPDKVVYVFASNHRSNKQLATVARALRAILEMVSPVEEPSNEGGSEIQDKILREVLSLSWCRVRRYLRCLVREMGLCVAYCQRSQNSRDKKLGSALDQIAPLVGVAAEAAEIAKHPENREPFICATEVVIGELEKLRKDTYLWSLIRRRVAREHNQANGTYWIEMCHISDRLKAYKSAVTTILIAGDIWPDLFESFEVRFIPSPNRIPNPLTSEPKTSAQLIQVSTSDQALLPRLKGHLAGLQRLHNIDEIIADAWRTGLKPTVHAEVQIHSWLETSGGTRSDRFFGKYKFIGSSKPTCKLCYYYFHSATDVKVRSSHWNLYTHWRVPDLYDYELPAGRDRRKELVHKIKKRVVADIERTINEKLADGRNHDSTDQRVGDTDSLLSPSVADTLSSVLDNLSIVGETDEASDAVETVTFQGRSRPIAPERP